MTFLPLSKISGACITINFVYNQARVYIATSLQTEWKCNRPVRAWLEVNAMMDVVPYRGGSRTLLRMAFGEKERAEVARRSAPWPSHSKAHTKTIQDITTIITNTMTRQKHITSASQTNKHDSEHRECCRSNVTIRERVQIV